MLNENDINAHIIRGGGDFLSYASWHNFVKDTFHLLKKKVAYEQKTIVLRLQLF